MLNISSDDANEPSGILSSIVTHMQLAEEDASQHCWALNMGDFCHLLEQAETNLSKIEKELQQLPEQERNNRVFALMADIVGTIVKDHSHQLYVLYLYALHKSAAGDRRESQTVTRFLVWVGFPLTSYFGEFRLHRDVFNLFYEHAKVHMKQSGTNLDGLIRHMIDLSVLIPRQAVKGCVRAYFVHLIERIINAEDATLEAEFKTHISLTYADVYTRLPRMVGSLLVDAWRDIYEVSKHLKQENDDKPIISKNLLTKVGAKLFEGQIIRKKVPSSVFIRSFERITRLFLSCGVDCSRILSKACDAIKVSPRLSHYCVELVKYIWDNHLWADIQKTEELQTKLDDDEKSPADFPCTPYELTIKEPSNMQSKNVIECLDMNEIKGWRPNKQGYRALCAPFKLIRYVLNDEEMASEPKRKHVSKLFSLVPLDNIISAAIETYGEEVVRAYYTNGLRGLKQDILPLTKRAEETGLSELLQIADGVNDTCSTYVSGTEGNILVVSSASQLGQYWGGEFPFDDSTALFLICQRANDASLDNYRLTGLIPIWDYGCPKKYESGIRRRDRGDQPYVGYFCSNLTPPAIKSQIQRQILQWETSHKERSLFVSVHATLITTEIEQVVGTRTLDLTLFEYIILTRLIEGPLGIEDLEAYLGLDDSSYSRGVLRRTLRRMAEVNLIQILDVIKVID